MCRTNQPTERRAHPTPKRGVCGICNELIQYAQVPNGFVWVHVETGDYRASEPRPHDCNTHIKKALPNCPSWCDNYDYGDCPRCFAETGLGCNHGPICAQCEELDDA